jgi:type IV pilus assembly protein PilM
MALFRRNRTTVGLDIGSGLVKAAVIDHGRGLPELVKVAITPLGADAIVDGEVMDPALVADAVRETLQAAGVKPRGLVVAVGGRDVIVKRIRTERVPESQARELMRFEAEQHVPFDMESVQLDFQILDPDSEGREMAVLLVAAKRELVEAKVRLLDEAGADVGVVDVDAFALHNAFAANYPDALEGVVALANVGHEVTNVNILDDGVPALTRDLAAGTRRIREDLQREHGLSSREAEQLLRAGASDARLDAVLARHADEIAAGVERAAAFLESASRTAGPLRALYLCGGGAQIPGLAQSVAGKLRIPVEPATPLAALEVRAGALDDVDVAAVAPLLMLPIGLALRAAA